MFAIPLLAVTFLTAPAENGLVERIEQLQLQNGLFLDRTSDRTTVSAAATGMGSYALAYAATRGLADGAEVAQRIEQAFHVTTQANPERNRGWLAHFTDDVGNPKPFSEISTIDTALFYMGMQKAAQLMQLHHLSDRISHKINQIDVDYVLRNGKFLHGFYWPEGQETLEDAQPEFIRHRWADSSEGVILYKLFDMNFEFEVRRVDYPLFVYLYPLMFFEDERYVRLLNEAVDFQISEYGYSGVTATDGPHGYTIHDRNLISPLLLSAVGSRFPAALETLQKYSLDPAIAAYYIPSGWINSDDLTIDLASAYVMLVQWKAYSHHEELVNDAAPTATR